jgi:hypothetical protein
VDWSDWLVILGGALLAVGCRIVWIDVLRGLRKDERRSRNPVEQQARAATAALAGLDERALVERFAAHAYFVGFPAATLRAAGGDRSIIDELMARVAARDYASILRQWESVTRRLVEAERATGHAGPPRLVAHEGELLAILRRLADERARSAR